MVRVAGLKGQVRAGVTSRSPDGLTPAEQLGRIARRPSVLASDQQARWRDLRDELAQQRHRARRRAERDQAGKGLASKTISSSTSFPVLTPLAIDPAHPFPFIPNLGFTIALQLVAHDRRQGDERADPRAAQDRALHAFAGDRAAARARCITLEQVTCLFIGQLFPGLYDERAGRVPRHARFRNRDRGRSRGSRALVRDRAEAAPARIGDPAGGRSRRCRTSCAVSCSARSRSADDEVFLVDGVLALNELTQLVALDRPDLQFVPYNPRFPGAHPRSCRRLLRGDPAEGPHRPPSVRILRRGGAVPAAGRARSRRRRDQADALSDVRRQPDRPGARRGRRGRQIGHRAGRAQGALRRGGQYPLGARPRARRRAGRVRLHRAEDARQAVAGRAARGRR